MELSRRWLERLINLDNQDPDFLTQACQLIALLDENALASEGKFISKVNNLLLELDKVLSAQLTQVLQHPEYQTLEARWRSVHQMVSIPYQQNRVKVRCLDYSWAEVSSDLNLSAGLKQSQLYNKIGNRELNVLGGEPFGMVLIDHKVSLELDAYTEYDELYTLELLGALGQICLCPFILSPDDAFFGQAGADWLSDINRVEKILNGPDFTAWQALRNKDSSRFIGLTLPRVALRQPYKNHKVGFVFNENVKQNVALWGGAHFAFAATVMREFSRISWFGFLKSRWNDRLQGAVLNLPSQDAMGHAWCQPQPDVRLFGRIGTFYAERGFIPLCNSHLTDKYFFADNRSVWGNLKQADDKVITLMQTTLICCRVAHFLKVQIREMLGSFSTAKECELFLANWLAKYVSNVSSGNDETLAKYPLRHAQVKVKEKTNTPGEFDCEVELQPQYQFDMFNGHILLTTELGEV